MLENRIFTGGLDQDSSDEIVANGDYRYALNCRVSTVGNVGQITNSMGTVEITVTLPSGTNQVIGSFENKLTKKLYYFLYNSNGDHTVYEYDGTNVTALITSSLFGFDPDFKITGVTMIENLLYWTDNKNESMYIDVERARAGLYQQPYKIEYFTQIKKPNLEPPTAAYVTNPDRKVNYLKNKLFQFKTRLVYSDNSKSVTSPISDVPYPSSGCNESSDYVNNAISISFFSGNHEVDKIELYFREGNTGDFYLIDTFDKRDPNASIPDEVIYSYTWYNDGIYNALTLSESIQLYDDIPQNYQALELIPGNRIARANGTHQFDQVNVQAAMVVDYQPTEASEETYSITGKLYIKNVYSGDPAYADNQPITKNQGDQYAVFGGFGPNYGIDAPHAQNAEQTYGQILPLNGFVVYLAGTEHYAITVQKSNVLEYGIQTVTPNNVYVNDGPTQRNKIRQALSNYTHPVYSTFTIPNVPKGTYTLRVAGVRMPNGQPMTMANIDATLEYQKTSTYTIQVGGVEGYEKVVEVNGDTQVGETWVCDLIDVNMLTQSNVVDGYLVDRNTTATGSSLISNDRIESALVDFKIRDPFLFSAGYGTYFTPVGLPLVTLAAINEGLWVLGGLFGSGYNRYVTGTALLNKWGKGICHTDHNGFFFFSHRFFANVGDQKMRAIASSVQGTLFANNSPGPRCLKTFNENIYDETGQPLGSSNFSMAGNRTGYILQNQFDDAKHDCATHIKGQIVDNDGNGVAGVRVVCTGTSRYDTTTAPDGSYSIRVWGDYFSLTNNSRAFQLLFVYNGACHASLSPNNIVGNVPLFNINIPGQGIYNNDNPYTVSENPRITFLSTTLCGYKHGGSYKFGIVYADEFGRLSTTMTNDWKASGGQSLNLNIPFEQDVNGIAGIARPRMSIFSLPPSWAKKYYIVRTKNTAMDYYLRFLVNSATYLSYASNSDTPSLESPGQGDKIRLDFYNISPSAADNGSFLSRNPGSLISLSYVKGMRVRLISDVNGVYPNGYWDMEVDGFKTGASLGLYVNNNPNMPVITPGYFVEVYVPKLNAKEQIFYEIAAAGDIVDGYHMGINGGQNQTASQEAIAKLTGGDTYYRFRNMPYYSGAITAVDQFPNANSTRRLLVEDRSYSDFYDLKVENIGRPSVVDKNVKKTYRPSTVWYSGQFIRDTFINRLNNVPLTAFEDYPEQYGPISKLYSGLATNSAMGSNIVDVYQKLRVGSILVDETAAVSSSSQQGILVGTTNVLSKTAKYYQGEMGLYNPESFAHYTQRRYFADALSQQVARLSNDGLEPISQYKMAKYFFNKMQYVKNGQCKVCAGYDTENMEYYLAFSEIELEPSKTSVITTPATDVITNGEFTDNTGWTEDNQMTYSNTGFWSVQQNDSWITNAPFPFVNAFNAAFFDQNPGTYIIGDQALLTSNDTFYSEGTTYNFEISLTNASFFGADISKSGNAKRTVAIRLKLGDTYSDYIYAYNNNAVAPVIRQITMTATGTNPQLSIVAEIVGDANVVLMDQYVYNVNVDYVRLLSTTQQVVRPGSYLPAETLCFNEGDNRWKSFWSFTPEWMDSYGVKLVSWKGGQLNIHNVNQSYGSLYGTFYPAELHVISNQEPFKVKTYLTIGENSTDAWEAYEVTTPKDDAHPNGQLSEALFQDFVMKEGVYYAPLMRDAYTPNVVLPLIEGDPIKGRTAKFKLKNIKDTLTKLFSFNINWIASERSNQ